MERGYQRDLSSCGVTTAPSRVAQSVMAAIRSQSVLVLFLLFGSSICGVSTDGRRQRGCSGDEVNLHVTGSLNGTGHPLIQVRLEQPASSEPRRLHVKVRDEPCASDGTVRRVMQAVVYGPQSGNPLPTPQRLQQDPDIRLNEIETIVTSTRQESSDSGSPVTSSSADDTDDHPHKYSSYTKVSNIGRYKVHQEKVSWGRAAVTCAREGATLAVPHSQREVDALWELKQSTPVSPRTAGGAQPRRFMDIAVVGLERMTYLVGVRRYPGTQNFTTIFGDELTESGFNTWAIEPSNEEHCGAMFGNTGLRSVSCDSEFPFICELPL